VLKTGDGITTRNGHIVRWAAKRRRSLPRISVIKVPVPVGLRPPSTGNCLTNSGHESWGPIIGAQKSAKYHRWQIQNRNIHWRWHHKSPQTLAEVIHGHVDLRFKSGEDVRVGSGGLVGQLDCRWCFFSAARCCRTRMRLVQSSR